LTKTQIDVTILNERLIMIFFYLIFGVASIFFAGVNLGMCLKDSDFKDWFISVMGVFFGLYLLISGIGRIVL